MWMVHIKWAIWIASFPDPQYRLHWNRTQVVLCTIVHVSVPALKAEIFPWVAMRYDSLPSSPKYCNRCQMVAIVLLDTEQKPNVIFFSNNYNNWQTMHNSLIIYMTDKKLQIIIISYRQNVTRINNLKTKCHQN